MQWVALWRRMPGLQREPSALSTIPCGLPSDRQSLHAATGSRDQILLKGIHAEGELDDQAQSLPARVDSLDNECRALANKPPAGASVFERSTITTVVICVKNSSGARHPIIPTLN